MNSKRRTRYGGLLGNGYQTTPKIQQILLKHERNETCPERIKCVLIRLPVTPRHFLGRFESFFEWIVLHQNFAQGLRWGSLVLCLHYTGFLWRRRFPPGVRGTLGQWSQMIIVTCLFSESSVFPNLCPPHFHLKAGISKFRKWKMMRDTIATEVCY